MLDDPHHYLELRGLKGNHCTRTVNAVDDPEVFVAPVDLSHKCIETSCEQQQMLFVWSAADSDGLSRLASAFADFLSTTLGTIKDPRGYIRDLAYTLNCKRSMFRWRSYIVASSVKGLLTTLQHEKLPPLRARNVAKLAYVFTGQGAQWHGMGRELVRYPAFIKSLQDSQTVLNDLGCQWSLTGRSCLQKSSSNADLS